MLFSLWCRSQNLVARPYTDWLLFLWSRDVKRPLGDVLWPQDLLSSLIKAKVSNESSAVFLYTHPSSYTPFTVHYKLDGLQAGHGSAVPQIRPRPPAGFMLMTLVKRKSLQHVLRLADCIDWIKGALFSMKWISFRQNVQLLQELLQISVLSNHHHNVTIKRGRRYGIWLVINLCFIYTLNHAAKTVLYKY